MNMKVKLDEKFNLNEVFKEFMSNEKVQEIYKKIYQEILLYGQSINEESYLKSLSKLFRKTLDNNLQNKYNRDEVKGE